MISKRIGKLGIRAFDLGFCHDNRSANLRILCQIPRTAGAESCYTPSSVDLFFSVKHDNQSEIRKCALIDRWTLTRLPHAPSRASPGLAHRKQSERVVAMGMTLSVMEKSQSFKTEELLDGHDEML
jgi:hypothetical protein